MSRSRTFALATLAAALLTGASLATAPAQISVNIGAAPGCPYGYFDYAPYDCAPYGYYGPDWFNGGLFIGAGPWFHGPHGFYGHVGNAGHEPANEHAAGAQGFHGAPRGGGGGEHGGGGHR